MQLIDSVNKNSTVLALDTPNESYLTSPLHKRYFFKQETSPDFLARKGIPFSYKPTCIKNYTVQGSAAVITGTAAGLVFERIQGSDTILLVNEVHDELVFECNPEWLDFAKEVIYTIMKDETMKIIKKKLGFEFKAPLEVDIGIGNTWEEAKYE